MKLLFDHNLSYRLVERLSDLFPDSSHVRIVGLERADDEIIWNYAQEHGFVIVTQDCGQEPRRFTALVFTVDFGAPSPLTEWIEP